MLYALPSWMRSTGTRLSYLKSKVFRNVPISQVAEGSIPVLRQAMPQDITGKAHPQPLVSKLARHKHYAHS